MTQALCFISEDNLNPERHVVKDGEDSTAKGHLRGVGEGRLQVGEALSKLASYNAVCHTSKAFRKVDLPKINFKNSKNGNGAPCLRS